MMIARILVYLVIAGAFEFAHTRHLRHHNNTGDLKPLPEIAEEINSAKNGRSLQQQQLEFHGKNSSEYERGRTIPYSYKKLDKMMKKAILKIILGDLHQSDMLLLKALNYSVDDVMVIREHELCRIKEEHEFEAKAKKQQEQELLTAKYQASVHRRSSPSSPHHNKKINRESSSFETYNEQAEYDYENGSPATPSSRMDYADSKVTDDNGSDMFSTMTEQSLRRNFDRAMEPHVVFKIRYDDSELESGSEERSKTTLKNHRAKTIMKIDKAKSGAGHSFQLSRSANERIAIASPLGEYYDGGSTMKSSSTDEFDSQSILDYENLVPNVKFSAENVDKAVDKYLSGMAKKRERDLVDDSDFEKVLNNSRLEELEQRDESATTDNTSDIPNNKKVLTAAKKRVSEYEGLEWVGGDVYRVIPEAMGALLNYEDEVAAASAAVTEEDGNEEQNENLQQTSYSSLDDLVNDTTEYQNDAADSSSAYDSEGNFTDNQYLMSYQRLVQAQRRDGNLTSTFDSQGQKAIEDIKLRVLAMTGRFNPTLSINKVQRERLIMFSPTCQIPHNTDPEAWSDPFSMNMHFQLNLTSGEHVVAAKLRLFKMPQDPITSPSSSSTYEEEDEDEKKIRISVYFYTKSLKNHRVKKRLMDSVVTPLTSQGSHLALDVRQALRFWRPNAEQQQQHGSGGGVGGGGHSSSGNHGLVVQVEDQDGRPLKPSLYIQEPSCRPAESPVSEDDEKAYYYGPALFVRACHRYFRLVDGKLEMYVRCAPSQRH